MEYQLWGLAFLWRPAFLAREACFEGPFDYDIGVML